VDDWYALDYVRTLARAAGLDVTTDDVQLDGVDLTLRLPGRVVPVVDVLVRMWDDDRRDGDDHLIELTEPEFNRLAGRDFTAPPYLLVWRVPLDVCPDVPIDVEDIEVRDLGIYVSLANEQPLDEPDTNRRRVVRAPMRNVLTGRSLRMLVEHA
jgi:hypothetical protein